jgi:hypothetical protein
MRVRERQITLYDKRSVDEECPRLDVMNMVLEECEGGYKADIANKTGD